MFRIEADRARFREIVRGRIRSDLRRYLSTPELLAKHAGKTVSVPLPQIELPHFEFADENDDGVGQGQGARGDALADGGEGEPGEGAAGDANAEHAVEVEVELEELAEMLGRELGLPRIEPRGRREIESDAGRYNGVRTAGPDSLRHFRRTFRSALRRTIASGQWDPEHPRVVPQREDFRFKSRRPAPVPDSSAVIFHMMDVSGSMGREQKEIVRIEAFWIDTWLRSQYRNLEVVYLVHDATAKQVDHDTFFHLRESGGTRISSAYELCLNLIRSRYPADEWNIYPFHYSDGDNWSARDTERCVSLLRDELLPRVNQFCYGQVRSAYGSGQFKKDLDQAFVGDDRVVTTNVAKRDEIADTLRAFLGAGR